MSESLIISKRRIVDHGEVFTASCRGEAMLDLVGTPFQGSVLIASVVPKAWPSFGTGRTVGAGIDFGHHQQELLHA